MPYHRTFVSCYHTYPLGLKWFLFSQSELTPTIHLKEPKPTIFSNQQKINTQRLILQEDWRGEEYPIQEEKKQYTSLHSFYHDQTSKKQTPHLSQKILLHNIYLYIYNYKQPSACFLPITPTCPPIQRPPGKRQT